MNYHALGNTETQVSEICLGTMTWGTQNTELEGHEQMDFAVDAGVNFFDTAEMYPTTPLSAETQGRTEEIIGTWFAKSGNRDRVILATKVTGKGPKYIRDGAPITAAKMEAAVEDSLRRLKTDYIDLYQLHWPNRNSYHFRQSWTYNPTKQIRTETAKHVVDVLECAQKLIDAGKIRHLGLSNETCWGTSQFLEAATKHDLPRVVSIQNEYSLMQRIFDLDLAELSHNENVGLLAFSPLAAGMLSAKYRDGSVPKGSRREQNDDLSGRYSDFTKPVLEKYFKIADDAGLDPAQMALAFCFSRPFMTSTIIGATTMEQLKTNIAAASVTLDDEVTKAIQDVYRAHPVPM